MGKMSFGKERPAELLLPEDQVELKPVFGLRPGVYISIAFLFVLGLALFFVLLYPGIVRPGSVVVFSSEPAGAALRVDNLYAGSSPCKVFIPKGDHVFETVLPGFEPESVNCTVPGRLFGSLLFPRRYDFHAVLNTADPSAALTIQARDYAEWTFIGEPTVAWQVPLSLSQGVYRIGSAVAGEDANGILTAAARFAVTNASLRDLVRAKFLAGNGGIAPSPLTALDSLKQIAVFLADNPGSAAWLADTLPSDTAAALISSAWYQNPLASFAGITAGESLSASSVEDSPPAGQIRVGGLLFTGLSGGTVVQGEPFPHPVPITAFMICNTAVPLPAYEDFLDANPLWRPDQLETLEKEGLVNSEYLADFGNSIPGGNRAGIGIKAVSWFAARAFCEWLSGKLPESFSGWEVRLPTEAEWEYAVKSLQRLDGISGTWEWCDDPYTPLPFLSAPPWAIAAIGSPERPVRGGSWLGAAGSVSPQTRASLPPSICSAFVSFRPVIARTVR
jgi:hypothetical protein